MAEESEYSYTKAYTELLNYFKENNGKGYSLILLGDVRPCKKLDIESTDPYDSESALVYFYSETEAQFLKKQIIKKPDGRLLLITGIRPQNIEIIPDDQMVKLIVQNKMAMGVDLEAEKSRTK